MRAVTCVLDLAKVFQFIEDGFNRRSLLEERLVKWRVLDRSHVPAHLGDEVQLTGAREINQPAGNVSLVCVHPAIEPLAQKCHWFAVIDIA